ncbi:MAG: DUF5686 family protein, partial [Capnocytophaga sp.]|nr:DUF5686 family protein [Capnocytophaga sp.]
MPKIVYILVLLFCIPFLGWGQTSVAGKVIDENGNPIPFANIIFKNTTIGTSSDNEGNFTLNSNKDHSILEVSFIGYATKEIRLKSPQETNLQVILVEGEELSEVTLIGRPTKHLSKKENPAYKILQNIWKNKHKNGLKQAEYYQYQRYTSTELGLNQLDSTFLKTVLKSDYKDIRKILSEKKYKQYFSMPMFLQEEVENVYGNNLTGAKRVDMEAERHQGVVQTGFGLERISRSLQEFDIYDNSFLILERPFVSPISEYGYGVYSYVLNDSIERNGQKFYTIYFFPRQEQDLAFQGSFVVGDKNYAIESIQMYITKQTNINLARNLSFEKYFKTVNDSIFLPEKDVYEGDFSVLSKSDDEKGMYVRKTVTYNNYQLNEPKPDDFYKGNIERYKVNQFTKDTLYWTNFANDKQTLKTQHLIKEVGDNGKIKGISDVIDILSSGYLPFNRFLQFGSIWNWYSSNDIEGSRFRLGFRSFKTAEDRFRTYFYGAYGLRDKKFKYGINAKYLLFQKPRVTVGAELRKDNLQLGSVLQTDDITLNFENPTITWFERGDNYYLTQIQKLQSFINFELLKSNLNITLSGVYQRQESANSDFFSISYLNKNNQIHNTYSDFNMGLAIAYTPKRKVYGYGVEQRFGKNTHPLYRLKFTQGISGIRNSVFDYSKIEATISYPVALWSLGLLKPTLEVGKTFGEVPLPLLSPTPTSQSYSIVGRTFSLLDYYDFVTDMYANLYLEHHFNGLIFNRLPLIKKTKWRSLIFARAAYGTISKANQDISLSNVVYNAP